MYERAISNSGQTFAETTGRLINWSIGPSQPLGKEGRKHGALRPQKPLRLIRDEEVGGSGNFLFNTYSLHCHHQNDSALRWAVV